MNNVHFFINPVIVHKIVKFSEPNVMTLDCSNNILCICKNPCYTQHVQNKMYTVLPCAFCLAFCDYLCGFIYKVYLYLLSFN